jgi:hypothetical protein
MTIAVILAWLAVLASPFSLILALKIFPKLLGDVVIKELEHRHNVRLEEIKAELARSGAVKIETLKGEITAAYSTLKSSVDFLSASQSDLRLKRVNAVEKLWLAMIYLKKEFADLLFIDTILVPSEIDAFFKPNSDPKLKKYFASIMEYQQRDITLTKWKNSNAEAIDAEQLFVSARLWQISFVSRALYGRVAFLFEGSFKDGRYNDWRSDEPLGRILASVLPATIIEQAKSMKTQGLESLVLTLHKEFLEEAERVMSGVPSLSKSIADMQIILLGEKDKLTADMSGKST